MDGPLCERDGLLQAILDDPEDTHLRLVYADWLEEQGDPRAEFIRVQCALEDLSRDDERRRELAGRADQLLERYGEQWRPARTDLASPPPSWELTFRRGFVDE